NNYKKESNDGNERRSKDERGRRSPHREESSRSGRMENQIWMPTETRNDSTSSTERSLSSRRSGFSNSIRELQHLRGGARTPEEIPKLKRSPKKKRYSTIHKRLKDTEAAIVEIREILAEEYIENKRVRV